MAESDTLITESGLFGYGHYEYGEAYYGSCRGMRFRLGLEPLRNIHFIPLSERDPDDHLLATVWPEPFSFKDTPDDEKRSSSFPMSEEGFKAAVAWLNDQVPLFCEIRPSSG